MKIAVIITSSGINAGPLITLTALPSGDLISSFIPLWTGSKEFSGVPDSTTSVRIEHFTLTGSPGLCGATILPVTLLAATTTTTTTGGVVPPPTTTTTTTSSSTSSTTTTTTTSGGTPPTSTTTTSSSSTTTTSSSTTSTTTTTVESCGIIGNMACGGVSPTTTTTTILDCNIQGNMICNLMN